MLVCKPTILLPVILDQNFNYFPWELQAWGSPKLVPLEQSQLTKLKFVFQCRSTPTFVNDNVFLLLTKSSVTENPIKPNRLQKSSILDGMYIYCFSWKLFLSVKQQKQINKVSWVISCLGNQEHWLWVQASTQTIWFPGGHFISGDHSFHTYKME